MAERETTWTRRRVLRGAATAATACILAACGGEPPGRPTAAPTPTAIPGTEGQITAYWERSLLPSGGYPHPLFAPFASTGAAGGIGRLMLGTLLTLDDTNSPMNDLAARAGRDADARTWRFTLRDGARFSDGTPVTARDVVFTIERANDPRTGSPWRVPLTAIEGANDHAAGRSPRIRGLETPDDRTVVMRLAAPHVAWLDALAAHGGLPVLPWHALKDAPPDALAAAPFGRAPHPVAGPFALAEWGGGAHLALRRNAAYTGGPPARLDRLVLQSFPRQEAGIAQLERGTLDLMPVPALEVARLRKRPDLTIARVPGGTVAALAVNCARPYLRDKRMRQAMLHATDRPALVKAVLKGEGVIVNSPIGGPGWFGTPGLNPYPYAPATSRRLLADANWPPGRRLTLTYLPGDRVGDATLAALQDQFRDVGLALDLLQVDAAEYGRRVAAGATPGRGGDFDLLLVHATRHEPDAAAAYFETAAATPAGANLCHYANPLVDDLFARGRAVADPAARAPLYTRLAQLLNDDLPWLPLWSPVAIYAHSRRLRGFKPPADPARLLWNAGEWSVAQ